MKPFSEAPWFEIDEDQYLMYLLKGYGIYTSKYGSHVYFNLDGNLHREDGPALIYRPDIKHPPLPEYWIHGKAYYNKKSWEKAKDGTD